MIVNSSGGTSGSLMTPYEYAVVGGYAGTEEEFKAALSEVPWIPAEGRIYENNTEAFNGFVPGHIGECNHFEGSGHNLWMSSDGHILQNCHISGKDNTLSEGGGTPSMPVVGMTILGTSHNIATCSNIYAAWDDDSYVPGGMVSQGTYECGQGIIVLGDSNSSMNAAVGSAGSVVAGCNNSVYSSGFLCVQGRQNRIELQAYSSINDGVFALGTSNYICGTLAGSGMILSIGSGNRLCYAYQKSTDPDTPYASYTQKYLSDDVIMIGRGLNTPFRASGNRWNGMFTQNDPDISGPGRVFLGAYNNPSSYDGYLIVGCGGSAYSAGKNGLRVTSTEVLGLAYKSSGADYAENFEWQDGNTDHEDRCGRFVTLDEDKIRLAQPDDDFILGIISGDPSVVGDTYDDQWKGMNERDVFGRYIWEDIQVPDEFEEVDDPDNADQKIQKLKRPAHTEHVLKINPDYNPQEKYIPRSQRPEWDAVGMMGKLVACDDGTCQPNGWATVGVDGIAVHSAARTKYRVMKRIDDSHVQILIL